jgi:metallo-beta-lactamase family protein
MSFDLMRVLLEDCCHICERDAELLQKQGHSLEPLYNADDVKAILDMVIEVPFNDKYQIDNDITIRFSHSGHITNSAHVEMWLTSNNNTKKIYYTSDLGNTNVPTYYVHDIEPVQKANLVIAESTYSNPKRQIKSKDREKDLEKIKCVVEQTMEKCGKVLIPVFANHRCQTMLTVLYELFGEDENFKIPIYVDSPMACKISRLMCHIIDIEQMHYWEEVMKWQNVHFISEYADSKNLQNSDEPCIVLASSGMLTAGRSVSWSQKLLGSAKNHFLFCGFAPEGSIADKIKNGLQKHITIDGKAIPNRAYVTNLVSFSSHIQHDAMLDYYSSINCEKIALVHGNFKDKEKFSKELQETIAKQNKTTKVICVNSSTSINL